MTAELLEPVVKLTKDIKRAALVLSDQEARFLVDAYYMMQDQRIRANNQVRACRESGEPNDVLQWFFGQSENLENEVKKALDAYSKSSLPGVWARSICGIGPVITAGLLAHIDIKKAPTAGHIYSFAGLCSEVEWKKGEKRPWNAQLKTLCWKIGEGFVKVKGRDSDYYGKVYEARKAEEVERNARKEFSGQAAAKLEKFKIGKTTEAFAHYSSGVLPPAHIHARAKRYAVKLFLSHLHHVWYCCEFKEEPHRPWVIEHGGHVHFIAPPNWPMEGFDEFGRAV